MKEKKKNIEKYILIARKNIQTFIKIYKLYLIKLNLELIGKEKKGKSSNGPSLPCKLTPS